MIMDDTNILPAMGHWVLHHSLEGRVHKLIELGSAIRKKNGLKGFNTETNSSSIKNQPITTKTPDLSNSGMVKTTTVHDIEPSSMHVCEALGITKERTSELLGEVDKALQSSSLLSQAIEKVSKSCVHINELAYCSFMIGQSLWTGIQTKEGR